jgi:hypothetical protein
MTVGPANHPFLDTYQVIRSYGPFDNSFPNRKVRSKVNVYVNVYK